MQILLEQLRRAPVELTLFTRRFARSKRFPFFCELYVTLDQSCVHSEVRAACAFDIPRPRAAMIFSLRSTEYALISG
jgi:hypothetical protein